MDESYIDDTPNAFLYQRIMDRYPKSAIGCFIISEDWDEQALLELKKESEAWFLVGLQIDNSEFEHLNIIEGIIRCQPDEVKDVTELLDVNAASTIIGIDVVDIKSLFECGNLFQFIQASATGESESDLIKVTTHKLVNQLSTARHTKGLFIGMESVQSLLMEAFAYVADAVEGFLSNIGESIYYRSSMTDELNIFHLKAIYALA
ncbi:hypothetical protein IP510_07325 [Psychrobacter sp. NG254]|uniref:hypothetical protein n=1 Tax=Psychrobacter sp. NG254 TaxID=2782003 RepID=UPI001888F5F1|nr:hypothetical protein [Psychrobacter sp. NG254]MBF2719688.1 hypothetical protein [Psychrobacter sp. NG254]